ncbi:MAG: glycosyltransferase family 4 protein [Patescibacteria group bacterium]
MKLLYIVNAKIPTDKANGYQIFKMCEEFSGLGARVELLLPTRESKFNEDPFEFYGAKRSFKVRKIKSFDFVKYHKYLGKFGFWLQSLFYFFHLIFEKVDKNTVIYSRNPEIIWLFNLRGCRTIFEIHRWAESKKSLFKFFIKKAEKVIVVTRELKKKALEAGFSDGQIFASPDGVDLKIFDLNISKIEARQKLSLSEDKIILGYTGRFETMGEKKGVEEILEAVKILLDDYPDIFFLAVGGSGSEIENSRNFSDRLGLKKNVLFLEKIDRSRLAICQKACDLLLMPFPFTQHFAYYMSPLKMFEYMASQRPIVATDLPSVREVLNEENALLIKVNAPEVLAEGIKKIIENKKLAETISQKAFLDVRNYTWEKRAENIIKFINDKI